MQRWIKGALVLPDRIVENGLLAIDAGRITGVWDLEREAAPAYDPRQTEQLEGGYAAPGYIDLHVHGGGGGDFMDGDPEAVVAITTTHARHGTTGLLATTLTGPEEAIVKAFRAVKAAPQNGARILGFHVEGPFINVKMKGAQDERYVRLPNLDEIDRWMAEGGPDDRWHVTLAPELDGAMAAIHHLVARGAVVSAGHTECTHAQLQAASEVGLSHVTHLFNAMRGLHHREPGTVGGALSIPGMTAEIIADAIHVHPASIAVAVGARGPSGIVLITDAMRAAGLGDGEYLLGELKAVVQNGAARLENGSLAGSVLTMESAVRNMVELVGIGLPAAVAMASLHPARKHRLDHRKGSLETGKDADLLLLDRNLKVLTTMVRGEVVHDRR